jgi:hypothetical protein
MMKSNFSEMEEKWLVHGVVSFHGNLINEKNCLTQRGIIKLD